MTDMYKVDGRCPTNASVGTSMDQDQVIGNVVSIATAEHRVHFREQYYNQ